MTRRGLVLTFTAVIVGIVLLFFLITSSDSNSEQTNTAVTVNNERKDNSKEPAFKEDSDPLTVEYTNNGFFPEILSIKKNEVVTFINRSSRSMWIASNRHPVHTIYPEFDQKSVSKTGEEYSFKFDRIGEWKYHDHINPRAGGLVIVEE